MECCVICTNVRCKFGFSNVECCVICSHRLMSNRKAPKTSSQLEQAFGSCYVDCDLDWRGCTLASRQLLNFFTSADTVWWYFEWHLPVRPSHFPCSWIGVGRAEAADDHFCLTNRFHVAVCLFSNRRQNVLKTKRWHLSHRRMCHYYFYPILTSSVIYYWTDPQTVRQHRICSF